MPVILQNAHACTVLLSSAGLLMLEELPLLLEQDWTCPFKQAHHIGLVEHW